MTMTEVSVTMKISIQIFIQFDILQILCAVLSLIISITHAIQKVFSVKLLFAINCFVDDRVKTYS